MALLASLQFNDNTSSKYLLTDFKCHTMRHNNGMRPDADVVYDMIELTVIVPKSDDISFYSWYIDGNARSGYILVDLSFRNKKRISFDNAVCFGIEGRYDANEGKPMELTLRIMPRDMKFNYTKDEIETSSKDLAKSLKVNMTAKDLNIVFPVQRLNYSFCRERNSWGLPFGPTLPSALDFVVNPVADELKDGCEYFLDQSNLVEIKFHSDDYSIKHLVHGYVVDADLAFNKDSYEKIGYMTMLMRVKLLIADISFDGLRKTNLVITK